MLFAIGVSMMCMVVLRRFSTTALLLLALAWIGFGELATLQLWPPHDDTQSVVAAFFLSTYGAPDMVVKYPLLPWLSMMVLGWLFGRYILLYKDGKIKIGPVTLLTVLGCISLIIFAVLRYKNGYGNMFLYRADHSWQHWLHVSKYPPSATFILLELGLMSVLLAIMMLIERAVGVRKNGVLLVFGQTAMMFYLVHRLILEGSATYGGLRHFSDIYMSYLIAAVMLLALYPFCLWYRGYKARHADSISAALFIK